MNTTIGIILVVLALATGFFAGYKAAQAEIIRRARRAIDNEWVETREELADFLDPNKPNPNGSSGNTSSG